MSDTIPNFDSYLQPREYDDSTDPRESCGAEHLDDADSDTLLELTFSALRSEASDALTLAFQEMAQHPGHLRNVSGMILEGEVQLAATLSCGCRHTVAARNARRGGRISGLEARRWSDATDCVDGHASTSGVGQ